MKQREGNEAERNEMKQREGNEALAPLHIHSPTNLLIYLQPRPPPKIHILYKKQLVAGHCRIILALLLSGLLHTRAH